MPPYLLLLLLLLALPAPAAGQASLVVDTTLDEADDGECALDCTLREAIGLVDAGGTITFDPGVTGTINLTAALPTVRDVTITGPGADVLTVRRDTGGNYRIFETRRTVAISGLTISNGRLDGGTDGAFGGGINNYGTLTLTNSVVSGNTITGAIEVWGSGIYNSGTLTLTGSTVSGNETDTGGNGTGEGGGIFNMGTLTIENSTISGNTSESSGGGLQVFSGTVAIRHSTFSGNVTGYHGSSISRSAGTVTVSNTVFERSAGASNLSGTVTSEGYNLCSDGCNGQLTEPTDRVGTDPMLYALAYIGGPTPVHLPYPGSPLIDAGDPATCPAQDQRGETRPFDGDFDGTAACDIGAVELHPPATLVVDTAADRANDVECDDDCTLREALGLVGVGGTITFDAGLNGATVNLAGSQGQLEITHPLTVDASALPGGLTVDAGAAENYIRVFEVTSGTASGEGAILIGMTITEGFSLDGGPHGPSVPGGGIYNNAGTLTLRSSRVKDNFTGGIYSTGTLTLQNTTVSYNRGFTTSILASVWAEGTVLIENSTIAGNLDGGLYVNSGSVVIRNSVFADNATLGGDEPDCRISASSLTVTHTLVEDDDGAEPCITPGEAGNLTGDPLLGPLADNGGPTLTHGPQDGSPLLDAGDAATCLATDQRGEARPDREGGTCDIGAIEVQDLQPSTLTVDTTADGPDDGECDVDCTLREAIALVNRNPLGGAITFSGVTGAISLGSALPDLMADITIQGPGANTLAVDSGGAFRVFTVSDGSTVAISGLTVSGGSAEQGGGIYNGGTLTVTSSVVSGNTASGDSPDGGGIYTTGMLTVSRSTLSGNTAGEGDGGGIYNTGGTLTVTNSTLSGNDAFGGGGIYNVFGTLTVTRSTISENDAVTFGGGIFNAFGTLTVGNSIVAGNTPATQNDADVNSLGPTTPTSEGYNLIGIDPGNVFTATGDRAGTRTAPLGAGLGPLQDNGGPTPTHLPLSSSPAINGGDPTTCSGSDQRGQPRPDSVDGVCDIGAVELQDPPPLTLEVDTAADEADDGECAADCTLREAIALVPYNGTITFDAGVTGTLTLTGALPALSNVTIQGPGADVLTVRRGGGGDYAIVTVPARRTVAISGLTLTNGLGIDAGGIDNGGTLTLTRSTVSENGDEGASDSGGGIRNRVGATLAVTSSTISGNRSGNGGCGGIYNQGALMVTNSTISGNSGEDNPDGGCGGIRNGGTLTVISSTITSNTLSAGTANEGSGGIYNTGTMTVTGSIVAGNLRVGTPDDVKSGSGTVTSDGYNLVGEDDEGFFTATGDQTGTEAMPLDPLLGPLQDNGGPTLTHALLSGSPALDAGNTNLTDDQRGVARPQGVADDIGAVEAQVAFTFAVSFWLEGAYDAGAMRTDLSAYLPQHDPYSLGASVASSDFFTADADGQQVVDWVWIELRTGDPTGTMATVARSAALLLANGTVKATDGTSAPTFPGVAAGTYWLVVGHRNHLAVMSAATVDCTSGTCAYDFGSGTAYGSAPLNHVASGVWALFTGDADGNGQVQNADKNTYWTAQAGQSGYRSADFDLNGQVQNTDKNVRWNANTGRGTQVPEV